MVRRAVGLVIIATMAMAGCLTGGTSAGDLSISVDRLLALPAPCSTASDSTTGCILASLELTNDGLFDTAIDPSNWHLETPSGTTHPVEQYEGPDTASAGETTTARVFFEVTQDLAEQPYSLSIGYRAQGTDGTQTVEIAPDLRTVHDRDDLLDIDIRSIIPYAQPCGERDAPMICHRVRATVTNQHPFLTLDAGDIAWEATTNRDTTLTPASADGPRIDPDESRTVTVDVNGCPGNRLTELRAQIPWFSDPLVTDVSSYSAPKATLSTSDATPPDRGSGETVPIDTAWCFGGETWTWSFTVNRSRYEAYNRTDRSDYRREYQAFVLDPTDDQLMQTLATRLDNAARKEGYDRLETANFVLRFVQSLPYTNDSVTTPFDEHPRYPLETLVDSGDCEDTSILYASLMRELGYDVIMIGPPRHMAVGVAIQETPESTWGYTVNGTWYYFAETTGPGWRVGEMPQPYQGANATIYSLESSPVLSQPSWQTEWTGSQYRVTVNVTNAGDEAAAGVVLYAAWDAGNNKVWAQDRCDAGSLKPNFWVRCTLYLNRPPQGERTRLIAMTWADNAPAKVSYSGWFTA